MSHRKRRSLWQDHLTLAQFLSPIQIRCSHSPLPPGSWEPSIEWAGCLTCPRLWHCHGLAPRMRQDSRPVIRQSPFDWIVLAAPATPPPPPPPNPRHLILHHHLLPHRLLLVSFFLDLIYIFHVRTPTRAHWALWAGQLVHVLVVQDIACLCRVSSVSFDIGANMRATVPWKMGKQLIIDFESRTKLVNRLKSSM